MLQTSSPDVLAYVRTPPKGSYPVVVAINMSAQPRTVSLDVAAFGGTGKMAKTLAASEKSLRGVASTENVRLPPYSAWVAEVR
jgi:hypothetical protein